ncbi:MAG: hypothetical protein J6Y60_07230 [Treponema sp.]|nr:hypothetical protein [Treponema sp.]
MKRKLFVISLMVLFAALFVSCADGLKGSMEGHSYGSGGHSGAGGGGNTSGGTTFLSGSVWKQSSGGTLVPDGGTITFSTSGNKATLSIMGSNQVWDYSIEDPHTARFTMYGSTTQYMTFEIDSYDDDLAYFGGCEYTRQSNTGGGNNSGGGGNSSGTGATAYLPGSVWEQTSNGVLVPDGATITFSTSGNKATVSITGRNQVWDYTIIDGNTVHFTMYGSTTQYMTFLIDSLDDNKASYGGCEYRRRQ